MIAGTFLWCGCGMERVFCFEYQSHVLPSPHLPPHPLSSFCFGLKITRVRRLALNAVHSNALSVVIRLFLWASLCLRQPSQRRLCRLNGHENCPRFENFTGRENALFRGNPGTEWWTYLVLVVSSKCTGTNPGHRHCSGFEYPH